jgi:hypothetical protein
MKKETKKPNPNLGADLIFNPESFQDSLIKGEVDGNGDPILLDGQANAILNKQQVFETDAKIEFRKRTAEVKNVLGQQESLSLTRLYEVRSQYLYQMDRQNNGQNSRAWVLKGAGMAFDNVARRALKREAEQMTDDKAMQWDRAINALNEEHQVFIKPQVFERHEYIEKNMVFFSEPVTKLVDPKDNIWAEEYPLGTEEAILMRS